MKRRRIRKKLIESAMMDLIDEVLPVSCGEYALTFEAAMNSWGCDNNIIPYGIDLVCQRTLPLALNGWSEGLARSGDRFFVAPGTEIPFRAWKSLGGDRLRHLDTIDNPYLGCLCIHPATLLDVFEFSPDIEYLWELRAFLAEIVHQDDMTDDELMTFDRYVRLG